MYNPSYTVAFTLSPHCEISLGFFETDYPSSR